VNPIDLVFIAAMGLIIYFGLIKPKNDQQAADEELRNKLVKDDRIVTSGGIHGRVVEVADDWVVLEVADKTRITLDKSAVARKLGEPKPA
jgi:preprotein translocase subunit YajC